jgi:hypothetical protein
MNVIKIYPEELIHPGYRNLKDERSKEKWKRKTAYNGSFPEQRWLQSQSPKIHSHSKNISGFVTMKRIGEIYE